MARQRIHIEKLRQADPRTLEILVQDAVRKPIAQISAPTVCDLVALSEVSDLPKALLRDLSGFLFRAGQEIADLPDGAPLHEFIDDLDTVDATRVPNALRTCVAREAVREDRDAAGRAKVAALVSRWEGTIPDAVILGTVAPKIHRAPAVVPDEPPQQRRERGATKIPRAAAPRAEPKPKPSADPDREKWLADAILARLARYREAGLAEAVLVAGLQNEARATYPDLAAFEVKKALEALAQIGKIRRNVSRWAATMRNWE